MSDVKVQEQNLDRLGIFFSLACTIHCLGLPLLTFIMPTFTISFEQEWIHVSLLFLLIPIALFSFINSKKNHGKRMPMIYGLIGISFLIFAVLFEEKTIYYLETTLTVLGSVFLIVAHTCNLKYSRFN